MSQATTQPQNPRAGAEAAGTVADEPGEPREAAVEERPFEIMEETPVPGRLRRLLSIQRHTAGLLLGALLDRVRRGRGERGRLTFSVLWILALFARPFVRKELRSAPFPVQLRRRMEILGPTYIKLGQVLSLREDLLPRAVTDELKNLLDRLPVVPFERYLELVKGDLRRPLAEVFLSIEPQPLGSASIAQIHRARTQAGEEVILKVVKPGIRETLKVDASLLKVLGAVLEIFLSRFRPRQVLREFVDYTFREVDLRLEADNAETFAANFRDRDDVVFPKIYREYSGENVLCMEFFDGLRPGSPESLALSDADKEAVVGQGAAAIIRMIYQDGFFHADLHPGNLIILPGPKAGFIDLGMVGRFDDSLRRMLMYYYYCLVMGDIDHASQYLTSVADIRSESDAEAFRRALSDLYLRWRRRSSFESFSLGQLILESVRLGGQYRIYFPVEMVLMVKALVTFEGVGHLLKPDIDVVEISKAHINRIFLLQFSPLRILQEGLRGAPELVDAVVKAPMLVTEGLRLVERVGKQPQENPLAGVRGTLFGGFCLVAGAILLAAEGPWAVAAVLFALGILVPLRRG